MNLPQYKGIKYGDMVYMFLNEYEGVQEVKVKGVLFSEIGIQYLIGTEWIKEEGVATSKENLRRQMLDKQIEENCRINLKIESYFK